MERPPASSRIESQPRTLQGSDGADLDLSIAQRLALSFAFVLLPVVLLAGLTLYEHDRIDRQQDYVDQVLRPSAAAALDAQTAYLRQGIALRAFVVTGDEARIMEYQRAQESGSAALAQLGRLPLESADQQLLASLTIAAQRYDELARRFIALVRQGPDENTWQAAERELGQAREEVTSRAEALADSQVRRENAARGAIDAAQDRMVLAFGVTTAIVLATGTATAVRLTRSVRRRVRRLVGATRALGRGDYVPATVLAPVLSAPALDDAVDDLWRDELLTLGYAMARAAETLRQRDARVEAHTRIGAELAATLEVEPLASGALARIAEYAGCAAGALYLYEAQGQVLRPVAGYALAVDTVGGDATAAAALRLGEGIPGQAAVQRSTVIVRDLPPETPFTLRLGIDNVPPRTVVAVPLATGTALIGVLVLASARDIGGDALSFAQSAAQQITVGLQNALAHRRLEDLAAELQDKNEELAAQNEEIRSQYEHIQAQNEELGAQREELEAQNEALQAQREQLLAADRQKDEFLATATHELKTPITAAKGYAQVALRQVTTGTIGAPGLREALATIVQQTDRVVEHIDRMLDASRATMGMLQLRLQETDLAPLVREQVHEAQARTTQHTIRLEAPSHRVEGIWDPLALEQVVNNLLSNAIRYSPDGGDIHVTLSSEDGTARLAVADQGIGIPAGDLPRLFERYFRHSGAQQVSSKGMGIGLYVSSEIVRAHCGRIEVKSEPGSGTTFTVILPLRPVVGERPEEHSTNGAAGDEAARRDELSRT